MHNNDAKITTSISKSYANNKKEELMKVINEAKAKLENVGYRSGLRASQSISDLSHSMGPGGGIGRMQRIATNYKPVPSNRGSVQQRNVPKRSTSSVGKGGASLSSGMGVRSVSVGMLNQASDSEPEPPTRGGLMKPTISSQNKVNGTNNEKGGKYVNPRSAAGIINRRKGLQSAYSSVNIASAAQDESSSEESPTSTVSTVTQKPAVPPRPRSIALEHKRIANVNASLNAKKTTPSSNMEMETMIKDGDLDNADLTNQLCSNIINQLVQTTTSVIQLHQRLKSNDESGGGSGRNNSLMIKELENAVIMTQNMLTKVTNRNIGGDSINLNNSTSMYEKCNDILNQVQKHVNNNG